MKKIISILVSVMMVLTALPVFADGETTVIPASVDIYEALDNFSADELEKTYTSTDAYTHSYFSAPGHANLNVSLHDDEDVGGYATITPIATTATSTIGGATIDISSLGIGKSGSKVFTASVKIKRAAAEGRIYLDLLCSKKRLQLVRFHYDLGIDWFIGGSATDVCTTKANVWYDITVTVDMNKGVAIMNVDGGDYDNSTFTKTGIDFSAYTDYDYTDLVIGYNGSATPACTFDIANISVKTSASSYDEKLDFEGNTKFTGTSNAWSANSKWTSTGVSVIQREKIYADAEHKNVAKLWQTSAVDTFINITHNIPSGTIGSDGTLGIEWSYFEHLYARVDLTVNGVDSAGNAKSLSVLTYTGNNWDYKFCGVNQANDMPKDGENWRRVRVILDLNKNEVQMNTWDETEPKRSAGKLETNDTNTTALVDFADITSAVFQVRPRTWGDGRYMCLDDMRVYKVEPLAYAGTDPLDSEGYGVSVTKKPEILFNNGIVQTDATLSNFKLIDSKGSEVSGKVGINGQRNGIEFIPDNDLKGNETYTLQVNNVKVEDMFGTVGTISKTITFTTEPVLTLVNFEFSKEEVTAGDLGATIEVKSEDKISKNIYAAIAIYNKGTHELVSIDTDSINAVTKTFELTANVPDDGNAYYAKAFVWNTDTTAAPYFAAETLGFND